MSTRTEGPAAAALAPSALPTAPWPLGWPAVARARRALAWASCRLEDRRALPRGRSQEADAVRWYVEMWRGAAGQVGADFRELGEGFCQIERRGRVVRAHRQRVSVDDAVTLRLAGNKPLVLGWLRAGGLPVAPHLAFRYDDLTPAWRFLQEQGAACVVKPAEGTGGGSGVTAGVRTAAQLAWAAAQAGAFGSRLMIERAVPGENYRLLYLDGAFIGAVLRGVPSVAGDGRSTIRDLIARENERRATRPELMVLRPIAMDRRCRETLSAAGLSLGSVPAAGAVVRVRRATNQAGDHETDDVTDTVGAALVRQGAAAAAIVGVRLAGVDVITTDPRVSLDESRGVILEVNTTPGLHLHVLVRNPQLPGVAARILDRLLGPGAHA